MTTGTNCTFATTVIFCGSARWLGVGRFTLMHQNIDHDNFIVEIRIDHPLFGRLFYQAGRFRQARLTHSAAVSAPDAAHTAVPGTVY